LPEKKSQPRPSPSSWIEGEHLLVDERAGVGGIDFSRMDSRAVAPLPHVVASFSPAAHISAKLGTPPGGTAFICSCTGMWRKAGNWNG